MSLVGKVVFSAQDQSREAPAMFTAKTRKLLLGLVLLLIVDVIWVLSSELTKYLYENEHYDKPFFCTYFKTSLFVWYLVAIGCVDPCKEVFGRSNNYALIDPTAPEDDSICSNVNTLSDSTFVPIKPEGASADETETDDDTSIKSVRFSRLAEVREMSAEEAHEALMARLSYNASLRVRRHKSNHKTARTALLFCILWFLANYLFQLALEPSETAIVTLLSSTTSIFTMLLAAVFPSASGDRLTMSKVLAVLCGLAGVVTITISDVNDAKMSRGIVLSLLSALFYAAYLVLVKHKSDNEEKINIPFFFGFVGLWNCVLLWPVGFVLHFTEIEVFEIPTQRQFMVLFINGLIGTMLSEALWLWACFLTSSLVGTLAITLQIPMSMMFDVFVKGKHFPWSFYAGSLPMVISLIAVAALLKHDDTDPLLRFCKIVYRKVCYCRRPSIVRIAELDDEQHESLIDSHD